MNPRREAQNQQICVTKSLSALYQLGYVTVTSLWVCGLHLCLQLCQGHLRWGGIKGELFQVIKLIGEDFQDGTSKAGKELNIFEKRKKKIKDKEEMSHITLKKTLENRMQILN